MLNVELCGSGDGWGSCAVFFCTAEIRGVFAKVRKERFTGGEER